MNDSVSSGLGIPLAADAQELEHAQAPQPYHLRIKFTGSGSEYFRIWIVNLLLMLLTLGIYYPWAKVRRLRYFYGNTLIDDAPLDFHANPLRMLKGYLLVALLFGLYSVAGHFSDMAGLLAFVIVMAIWPALLKSSMQFRMANTSWRGLRFGFKGSLADAYQATLPLFVPSLLILGVLAGVADADKPPPWFGPTLLALVLLSLVVTPWLLWKLKAFQHNHYALASLQTTFKASVGSFYAVFFKTLGVLLLAVLLSSGLGMAFLFALKSNGQLVGLAGRAVTAVVAVLAMVGGMVTMLVVVKPYVISRMQNLVWTRTGNASLRFVSELRFKRLLWLTLKNWLLIVLTLGLYWPFAAVALARVRLEAVTVKTRISPDSLVQQIQGLEGEAAGDAAGDLFGLDIGL
jgi:uncharacterized membrane protein YjgN (DUF898 family)